MDRNKAGRYPLHEACEIVDHANYRPGATPNEAMVMDKYEPDRTPVEES
jgi:hypothetical protein